MQVELEQIKDLLAQGEAHHKKKAQAKGGRGDEAEDAADALDDVQDAQDVINGRLELLDPR